MDRIFPDWGFTMSGVESQLFLKYVNILYLAKSTLFVCAS
jgi:hypothetical protein